MCDFANFPTKMHIYSISFFPFWDLFHTIFRLIFITLRSANSIYFPLDAPLFVSIAIPLVLSLRTFSGSLVLE